MMDNWPICTEFPEDVWKVSTWYPERLVNIQLRKMIKEGKKIPEEPVVKSVLEDIRKIIIDNKGLSAHNPVNFDMILKRLYE